MEQAVAIVNFAAATKCALRSAQEAKSLNTDIVADNCYELQRDSPFSGPMFFQPQAHWCYFSLNEHSGPFTFFPIAESKARRWAAALAGKASLQKRGIYVSCGTRRRAPHHADEDVCSNGKILEFLSWPAAGP